DPLIKRIVQQVRDDDCTIQTGSHRTIVECQSGFGGEPRTARRRTHDDRVLHSTSSSAASVGQKLQGFVARLLVVPEPRWNLSAFIEIEAEPALVEQRCTDRRCDVERDYFWPPIGSAGQSIRPFASEDHVIVELMRPASAESMLREVMVDFQIELFA